MADSRQTSGLSRTTWVSQHQKTNVDFNEARDDWVAVASAGPHANHLPRAGSGAVSKWVICACDSLVDFGTV